MKKILKKVYGLIPFKREFYSFLKLFWKPKQSIYQHLHFIGVFKVFLNNTNFFKIKHYGYEIENEVFWTGLTNGWEKESITLWIKLCENQEVIFDIGANTGIYSLIAKTVNPKAKVYAFEPVSRVFAKLKENISLNQFDITPIEKAVSNSDGTATIYDTASEHTYSVTVNKNTTSPQTEIIETTIDTVTLNSFIKQHNIKGVGLMKIDVETHEPEVLEGFSDFILQFKPTILIEILNDEVGKKVSNLVSPLNYLYFNINEKGGVRQVDKITKSDYYNYLFCHADTAKKIGLIQ